MGELDNLDEIRQEVVDRTSTRKQTTMLWVQQNHKILKKYMGDIVIWFPKGRKEHIEFFFKRWFGLYKIYFSPQQYYITHQHWQVRTKSHFGEHWQAQTLPIFGTSS